jgi:hypothetical protein
MPKRRNLVAFWAIFWYKGICTTGSILIEAVISEAHSAGSVFPSVTVRIGCSRVRHVPFAPLALQVHGMATERMVYALKLEAFDSFLADCFRVRVQFSSLK